MRKIIILGALAAVTAMPMAADARKARPAGTGPAAKACRAERQADPAAFKTKYGNDNGRHAFRRCVRARVRAARQECRAERKADPAAFKAKYGNKNGSHAFRRCVRQQSG